MPNIGGPFITKRRLLATVVTNKILYAAPVWAPYVLRFRVNCAALVKAQRTVTMHVARCY